MARISIVMPCYGRPQRTRRAIESIKGQTVQDFEAFVFWDKCPLYDPSPIEGDPRFTYGNMPINSGYCGYQLLNLGISLATSPYFVFLDNDNFLESNHFESYLGEIEGTDYDFVYFDMLVRGTRWETKLAYSRIDQGAVIVRTDVLKDIPAQSPLYWKDWEMVQHLLAKRCKHKKSKNFPTYHMMTNSANRVDPEGID
jgi:glycosyltransferase involved in cell wall biosynthesis